MHTALSAVVALFALLSLALIVATILARRANHASGVVGEYATIAVIKAPPESVWRILTDAPGYADWNPELIAIDGTFAEGARIVGSVRLGSGAIRKVALLVSEFRPPQSMVWIGGMPLGLFIGRRTLTVTPRDDGSDFRMDLSMTGALAPLILKSVGDRQSEIDSFASALKTRAERE